MNVLKGLGRNGRVGSALPKNPLFRAMPPKSRGCLQPRAMGFSKSTELRELTSGNNGRTCHARKEAVGKFGGSARPLKNCIVSRESQFGAIGGEGPMQLNGEKNCSSDNVVQRSISWRNFESNGFYRMMKGSAADGKYVVPAIPTRKAPLCQEEEKQLFHGIWWNAHLEQITESLTYICQFPERRLIQSEGRLLQGVCSRLESPPDEKSRSIPFLCSLTYLDDTILNDFQLYPRFSRALNNYCRALLPHLCTDEILQVFHCYRLIGSPAIHWQGSFPQQALMALERQMHTFKSSELVQLCYFIGICRKEISDMTKLQRLIEKHIGSMTIGQLALVISAFFKTNVPIVDNLILSTMVYKARQGCKTIDPLYFTMILKSLRFHQGALKQPTILMLFLEFMHLDTLATEGFSHLVHYATAHLIYQETLMQEIRNRVACEGINSVRLKDVVKFLMYVSRIGYSSQHADVICTTVMHHLKSTCRTSRAQEIKSYPFTFINCIAHLSSMNKYDPKLLDLALSERFLGCMHLDQNAWWDIWFVDRSLLIDFPEYKHNRLSQNHQKQLTKISVADRIATSKQQRVPHFEQIISAVAFTLKNMFNCSSCVLVGRVLPQYIQKNIIVRLDKATGRGVPISGSFLPETLIQPRFLSDTDDANWLAFELVLETKVILGTSQPHGLHQTKLRHLRSLGYVPYTIMEPDWSKHITETERFSYLGKLVSNRNDGTA